MLIGVTYGLVIAMTLLAAGAYYYMRQSTEASRAQQAGRAVPVGEVWVTMYPNASLEPPTTQTRGDTIEGTMSFRTTDSIDRVLSFYQQQLGHSGFQVGQPASTDAGGSVQAMRQGGRMRVLVVVEAAKDGTQGLIRTFAPHDAL